MNSKRQSSEIHYVLWESYLDNLRSSFTNEIFKSVDELCSDLLTSWRNSSKVFICGNGGSAANAIHIANDLIYGAAQSQSSNNKELEKGLDVEALTANSGVLTCLANDIGYDHIFSYQLETKAQKGDLLIALSGSGNSANIINALQCAQKLSLKTHSILGFDGGKCKSISDNTIHIDVNDMQIAEDSQLIIGHLCMKRLNQINQENL